MKIIYNDIIPFKGYKCVNLFGVLFVRKGKKLSYKDRLHEKIHTKQMQEMLYIPFYVWYLLEWLIKLPFYKFKAHTTYRSISFEREAYIHEYFSFYPNSRKHFAWTKYIFKEN